MFFYYATFGPKNLETANHPKYVCNPKAADDGRSCTLFRTRSSRMPISEDPQNGEGVPYEKRHEKKKSGRKRHTPLWPNERRITVLRRYGSCGVIANWSARASSTISSETLCLLIAQSSQSFYMTSPHASRVACTEAINIPILPKRIRRRTLSREHSMTRYPLSPRATDFACFAFVWCIDRARAVYPHSQRMSM